MQGHARANPPYRVGMARLEVHWTGERQAEVAAALERLGLVHAGGNRYVAKGEGRTLIRSVGAVHDLERRVHSGGGDNIFTVHFVDEPTEPVEESRPLVATRADPTAILDEE